MAFALEAVALVVAEKLRMASAGWAWAFLVEEIAASRRDTCPVEGLVGRELLAGLALALHSVLALHLASLHSQESAATTLSMLLLRDFLLSSSHFEQRRRAAEESSSSSTVPKGLGAILAAQKAALARASSADPEGHSVLTLAGTSKHHCSY